MIDPSQPVTLKKHAVYSGNLYHPREYRPGELPIALLTEEYVSQGSPDIPTFSPFAGSFEETKIIIGAEVPNNEQTSYGTTTVIVPPASARIQINEATIEAISSLEGLSITVAKKVVEERVKSPFTSLDDLKVRVPLSKLKWEAFTDRLLFDNTLVEQKPDELSTGGAV